MPAHNAALTALEYNTESAFGEVSTSFGTRLSVADLVFTPSQEMMDVGRATQYQNDENLGVRGVFGGSISFKLPAHGLGSTAAGSISAQDQITFLGHVIGNTDVTSSGTTTAGGTVDADTVTVAAATGFPAGGLARFGAIADGEGNGQVGAVSTHSGSVINLLTALDAVPANASVVYAMALVYPFETPTTSTVQSLRFQFLSANQHYDANGCWPRRLALTLPGDGGIPFWEFEFGISAWRPVTGTFPSAKSPETFAPVATTAGSVFDNAVGTTTRVLHTARDYQFNFDLSVTALTGPGALRANQNIIAAVRGKTQLSYSFVIDSEATGTDTAGDLWNVAENSAVYRHHLFTFSAVDGYSTALYAPRAKWVGARPTQFNRGGRWMKKLNFRACTGPTATDDLTLSNFRYGIS